AGQIDQASKDCDSGLAAWPDYPPGHDARGLIYLRTGAWDKALAEFDAALSVFPNVTFSFYGRRLARLKQADIANTFAIYGLTADQSVVAAPPACRTSGAAAQNLAAIAQCEPVYCAQDAELQTRRNLKHIDDMLTELRLQ